MSKILVTHHGFGLFAGFTSFGCILINIREKFMVNLNDVLLSIYCYMEGSCDWNNSLNWIGFLGSGLVGDG